MQKSPTKNGSINHETHLSTQSGKGYIFFGEFQGDLGWMEKGSSFD